MGKNEEGLPPVDKVHVAMLEFFDESGKRLASTKVISEIAPTKREVDALAADARELGIVLKVRSEAIAVLDRPFGEVARQHLDVIAYSHTGRITGATVDPAGARMNELERGMGQITRTLAQLAEAVSRLAVPQATPSQEVARYTHPEAVAAAPPAFDSRRFDRYGRPFEAITGDQPPPPTPASPQQAKALEAGFPLVGTPVRRVVNEGDNDQMSVAGPSPISHMFVGTDGDDPIEIGLPTVGDTLRPIHGKSDIK